MNSTYISTLINRVRLHAIARPCSMVTVTSPISGKEHLQ